MEEMAFCWRTLALDFGEGRDRRCRFRCHRVIYRRMHGGERVYSVQWDWRNRSCDGQAVYDLSAHAGGGGGGGLGPPFAVVAVAGRL